MTYSSVLEGNGILFPPLGTVVPVPTPISLVTQKLPRVLQSKVWVPKQGLVNTSFSFLEKHQSQRFPSSDNFWYKTQGLPHKYEPEGLFPQRKAPEPVKDISTVLESFKTVSNWRYRWIWLFKLTVKHFPDPIQSYKKSDNPLLQKGRNLSSTVFITWHKTFFAYREKKDSDPRSFDLRNTSEGTNELFLLVSSRCIT